MAAARTRDARLQNEVYRRRGPLQRLVIRAVNDIVVGVLGRAQGWRPLSGGVTLCYMHLRRLSSSTTPLFKFVWPVGFLGSLGFFLAQSLLGLDVRWGSGITPFWGNVLLVGLLLAGLAVSATLSIPLKRVDYDGEILHISNYLSTDRVAVNQVSAVRVYGKFWHNERPTIKLRFRDRTRFGRHIAFIAASPELLDDFCRSLAPDVTVRR